MEKDGGKTSLGEVLRYILFGVLAALLNYGCYLLLRRWGVGVVVSTALAWLISVVFAYYTNKLFVFGRGGNDAQTNVIAATEFYGTRALTFLLEEGLMVLTVSGLHRNDRTAKAIVIVVIGVINYLISKLLVFRSRGKQSQHGNEE